MFSFKVILISSICLIIASFICSTSGKATSIRSLAENAKYFLKKVKKLDRGLKLPDSLKKFREINYRSWIKKIRCETSQLEKFIAEFKKLTDYTEEVAKDYIGQIQNILQTREVGNQKKRTNLCMIYQMDILPEFTIEGSGSGNLQVYGFHHRFTYNLALLHDEIFKIKSPQSENEKKPACGLLSCFSS